MLLFIKDRGRVKENDLTAVCKNYYTSVKVVRILVDANLVHSWVDDSGRSTTYYELTSLGADVARDLKRANDRILGLAPEPEDNFSVSQIEGDKMNGAGDLH